MKATVFIASKKHDEVSSKFQNEHQKPYGADGDLSETAIKKRVSFSISRAFFYCDKTGAKTI